MGQSSSSTEPEVIFPHGTCTSFANVDKSNVTQHQDVLVQSISDNGTKKRQQNFTPRKNIKIRRTPSHERRPIFAPGALFHFPGLNTNITIRDQDINCIKDPDAWINDIIIDWYLGYLHTNVLPAECRDLITIYNSMFFKRIHQVPSIIGEENAFEADDSLTEAQKQHRRVKNWARHRHIWTKPLVLIPVCFNGHWILVTITRPGAWKTPNLSSISILDSMDGRNQFIAKTIHNYLAEEWKVEVGETYVFLTIFHTMFLA